ncbi:MULTISPECIES: serine hydrolase [unclassified Gemella]|uniref:serine hydrolase n=1 Tax=unclassified Gemella TaxID=2624949 RepID=UPI0015CFBCB2|nr:MULTISPECIES: serine hydrolase [unclassified Gemella]MBF0709803.1 serine hydrolase [Gemella sp. GL1.1]NYS27147.1 serine hydrolase [Gemella sp. GL1]
MNKKERRRPSKKKVNKNFRRMAELVIIFFIIAFVFTSRAAYDDIFKEKTEEPVVEIKEPPATTTVIVNSEQEKYNNEQMTGAINSIIAAYEAKYSKAKISVIYQDIKSGYRYGYNDKEYFSFASTAKVIYAMDTYNRIASGEIDPSLPLAYKASYAAAGNGHITNNPKKKTYELEYVIMNMITYSDNTATNILLQGSNYNMMTIVNRVYAGLGISTDQILLENNKMRPESVEKVWLHLYKNQDKYQNLIKYLKDTQASAWIKQGIPGKTIASKYGQIPNVSNDTSIVFGENGDYLLLIYTEGLPNPGTSIPDIARQINELHDEKQK